MWSLMIWNGLEDISSGFFLFFLFSEYQSEASEAVFFSGFLLPLQKW